jgi:hypothetical protein
MTSLRFAGTLVALALAPALATVPASARAERDDGAFTVAVIPDTQNYVDYSHQTEDGFPFDAREIFYDQMDYIARHARSQGGEIAFAVAVGDIWQHAVKTMDQAHARLGLKAVPNKFLDEHLKPDQRTVTVEMPIARQGYRFLDGKLPFAVVPGNHDYDANWSDSQFPPADDYRNPGTNKFPYGQLHYGGLDNFRAVFGRDQQFFKNKPWYLGSFNGGADNVTTFTAGGYKFLHLGLEMAPADDVLKWAEAQIKAHPGLPTIVSTRTASVSRFPQLISRRCIPATTIPRICGPSSFRATTRSSWYSADISMAKPIAPIAITLVMWCIRCSPTTRTATRHWFR